MLQSVASSSVAENPTFSYSTLVAQVPMFEIVNVEVQGTNQSKEKMAEKTKQSKFDLCCIRVQKVFSFYGVESECTTIWLRL